jgi:hypothetical protein
VGGYVQEHYGATLLYRGAAFIVLVTMMLQLAVVSLGRVAGAVSTSPISSSDNGLQAPQLPKKTVKRSPASIIARRILGGNSKRQPKWAPLTQDSEKAPASEMEVPRALDISPILR